MAALDVIVIGGGIVGLACAEELSRRGRRVAILEKRAPGAEASWAAGGMLAADYEPESAGPLATLALDSRARWRELAARLGAEWHDVGHRECGTLVMAPDDEALARLRAKLAWLEGAKRNVQWLSASEARKAEPALGDVAGGALLPDDGVVNNRAVLLALVAILRGRSVEVRSGAEAALWLESGRVRGVIANGERVEAGAVVVAAGAWSGGVGADESVALPSFHPVRGQMLGYPRRTGALARPVRWEGGYAVPRGAQVVVGTTVEPAAGFDKRVTTEGREAMHEVFRTRLPALASSWPTHAWAGLRPVSADGLPAIGRLASIEGLFYAAGLGRDGILLTAAVAESIGALVTGERAPIELAPFDPSRASLRVAGRIVLNGASRAIGADATVGSLLGELDLKRQGIAVALNEEVVRRGEWDSTALKDRDRVEIIHAVGGG